MSEATHETFATSTDRHSVQGREGSDHGHTGIDEENRARSPLQPSMIRSIVLIFTCTAAMVVNVRVLFIVGEPTLTQFFF